MKEAENPADNPRQQCWSRRNARRKRGIPESAVRPGKGRKENPRNKATKPIHESRNYSSQRHCDPIDEQSFKLGGEVIQFTIKRQKGKRKRRPKSDKPIEIPLSVLSGGQCQLDDEFADLIRSYWQSQCRRRLSAGRSNGEQPGSRRRQTGGKWLQRLVEVNVQLFMHANQHKIQEANVIRNNFDETLILSLQFVQAL